MYLYFAGMIYGAVMIVTGLLFGLFHNFGYIQSQKSGRLAGLGLMVLVMFLTMAVDSVYSTYSLAYYNEMVLSSTFTAILG